MTTANKIAAYATEILPNIRKLLELKETLKEWKAEDQLVQEYLQEIKDLQATLKAYVEDKEATLVGEIKDLEKDISLACKGAAKGSMYKPAELKQFFTARAKEKVEDVIGKGDLFSDLNKELA